MINPVLVIRHVPHESLGALQPALEGERLAWQYVDVFEQVEAFPFDPQQAAGLIVLGGPMNVDQMDGYPFLATEVEWLRAALAAKLPVLGICLGSQLLAKALGARVYANRVKEIGWHTVELTPAAAQDALLADSEPRETVFQWHGDTFDLPAGAVHLARSAVCEQQAFRHGARAFGLQFHVEVTAAMIGEWLVEPGNCAELSALDEPGLAQDIRRSTPDGLRRMQPLAERILSRFARLCRLAAGC